MSPSNFVTNGFAIFTALLESAACKQLAAYLSPSLTSAAGTRALLAQPWCRELATRIRQHSAIANLIPPSYVAAQCTYFEKSQTKNWLVAMHQDIAIPVAARVDHAELHGWSQKEGILFVNAPVSLLQQLVAVRVHLDPCTTNDGPLRVIPGSHLRGKISTIEAALMRQHQSEVECLVERGGAMVLSPLLLHASSKARGVSQRRVLHFLFGPSALPFGLEWNGAV